MFTFYKSSSTPAELLSYYTRPKDFIVVSDEMKTVVMDPRTKNLDVYSAENRSEMTVETADFALQFDFL